MTIPLMALLAGLFGVPALLLIVGHRLRRRSARTQSVFWGALLAHIVAALAALLFSMIPPEGWHSDNFWRGAFTLWALLVLPLIGAGVGAAVDVSRSRTQST